MGSIGNFDANDDPYRIAHSYVLQFPPLDHVVNGRGAHPKRFRDLPDAHQIDLSSTP
jgi:hypothetical protein